MVWVAIVVALVMAVVGELLRPKPKFNDQQPSAVGDFSFPTADASRVIPVFWGTCKMEGPNTTWFGDLTVVVLKKKVKTGWFSSKKIVTGFNYYLGVQLVFAYGECDEFIELRADDKVLNVSTTVFTGDVCTFNIDSPTIIDNEDPPSGVKGPCRLYKGTFGQPPNVYLSEQWGEPDMTAFRPLVHLVMEKCYLGNTETPPPIALIARRCPNQLGLTGGKHNVNGDSNIACAVYEVMTNNLWGMKIPLNKIDIDSFIECGNTTAEEGLGISMLVQTSMLGKDLAAEMLRHADGVVYADPVTGLYTMKLARDDYDVEELLVIDSSNIVPDTFEFSRTSWEMTKNTIIVKYTDRSTFDVKPVQYQDLANIDVRGGMIDSEEINFLGFSNPEAALNTAARASKVKASPLVSAKFSVNRIGYQLRPGSVFRLQKPDRGLANVIMRVIEISYGTLDDPPIKISAMEDIFAVNSVAYDTPEPSDWVSPVGPVGPFTHQRIVEAPFYGSDDESRRYIITMGVPDSSSVMGYDVFTDPTGGTNFQQTNGIDAPTPSGVLVGSLLRTGDEIDATGVTVEAVVGVGNIEAGSAGAREGGENLILVNNEIMAWSGRVDNLDGSYTFTGVFRAVLDTAKADHGPGDRVYFLSEGAGMTNVDGYGADLTVNTKLVPKSLSAEVPIGSVTALSLTTNARALRPLPPGRLRMNGAVVGAGASFTGDTTFSWAHRNRLDESIASQADLSRVPEEGTEYNIYIYNAANALLVSALNVSSAASDGVLRLTSAGDMRIEIESVRGGLASWTKLIGYFEYTPDGAVSNQIVVDEPEYVLDGGGA